MYLLIFLELAAYLSRALGWSFEPCSEFDYKGTCELVEYNGCLDLATITWTNEQLMHDAIKSIKKVNGCVRLFEKEKCEGKSQAYYTGAWGLQDLRRDNMASSASSIGPCFEYECANKNFEHGEIDCVSHDAIYLGENPYLETVKVKDENNPIIRYQRGYSGRVEYVLAMFKPRHLYSGSKADSAAKAYAAQMGTKRDVAGMIIGPRLGGNGSLTYNVFPQNGYIANSVYPSIIESLVFQTAIRSELFRWDVNLHYDDVKATRPSALTFYNGMHVLRHLPNPVMN